MNRRSLLLLLGTMIVAITFAVPGCNRWKPNVPRRVAIGNADLAFEATMATLQGEGYVIEGFDPHHLSVHARAKLDAEKGDRDHLSWIIFQAYGDGTLEARVRGRHVKEGEGVVHKKLVIEVETLLHRIHYTATTMAQNATY